MGAPRFAASASGAGPSPRNSRTATPGLAGDDATAGSACAHSTAGQHAASTAVNSVTREATPGHFGGITLLRRPATIDENIGAGNAARGVRAQITRQRSELFHQTSPPNRQAREELPVELGVVDDRGIHVRVERPGTDGIYRNALS